MNSQAIETEYKGYRFRSRLEARWAVFFNALGIAWVYEPEGFQLSDGTRYLPDFWLPEFNLYVEIKPCLIQYEELDKKLSKFRDEIGSICLLSGDVPTGIPFEKGYRYYLFAYEVDDGGGGPYDNYIVFLCLHQNTPKIGVASTRKRRYFTNVSMQIEMNGLINLYEDSYLMPKEYINSTKHADAAARSARFEYGEMG